MVKYALIHEKMSNLQNMQQTNLNINSNCCEIYLYTIYIYYLLTQLYIFNSYLHKHVQTARTSA